MSLREKIRHFNSTNEDSAGGYVPGVDDPFLDPLGFSDGGSRSEGDECNGRPSAPAESAEFHLGTTPTEFHTWGEPGEQVAELLARLRRTDGKLPRWRLPFELARVLKAFPASSPVEFEELATTFFRAIGLDVVEGWAAFVSCWEIVQNPSGQDAWDRAVESGKASPLFITPDPGASLSVLASVAAYLAIASPDKTFVFSVPRVARSFGWSKVTASRAINALVALNVIEWTDPTWSFTERRARVARFIAAIQTQETA